MYHKGPEALAETVTDLLGVPIDYYITVDVEGFVALVDELGGIDFDVPVRMSYDDPTQDLHIHYEAGCSTWTGGCAQGGPVPQQLRRPRLLPRQRLPGLSRRGHRPHPHPAAAHLRHPEEGPVHPQKLNAYVELFLEYVDTDLEFGEVLWFAQPALGLDFSSGFSSATLEGENVYYVDSSGYRWGSCYQLDPEAALETVNSLINPFDEPMTADDLNIFQK